ncbi:hypothetical protein NQ315_013319 [Exocentrus adspersus]|uniref:Tyr recombinase domain-containing protein n=1 Tax=Exocentrus adspersus TaxID=1586481 RepID=A0AAV8V7B7_9CUCU|nr:hypothetical protein NQ315_013319 [Exocentrus adspersus]
MENVKNFLKKAADADFLFMKAVMIIALHGACRAEELRLLKVDDVEDSGLTSENGINGIELYRKYLNLRPKHVDHRRLLIYYKSGKCTVQPVGINTLYSIPKKIAACLGLPKPNSFTGHCFRRTSATFLADSEADIQVLKRHDGWRSSGVAEAYVEDSIENKAVVISAFFLFAGACRSDELINMVLEDISDTGDILVLQIPDSKTNIKRTFTITNEILNGVSILDMYRKYLDCRSPKTCHSRFFVTYVKGKCTNQVIGKNTIAKIPYRIAIFLNLDDSKGYTGHSFRLTSATLLVNAGSDILTLKKHGGWRTNAVAEGTSSTTTTLENNKQEPISTSRANISSRGISISNLTNCTIHFNNI